MLDAVEPPAPIYPHPHGWHPANSHTAPGGWQPLARPVLRAQQRGAGADTASHCALRDAMLMIDPDGRQRRASAALWGSERIVWPDAKLHIDLYDNDRYVTQAVPATPSS